MRFFQRLGTENEKSCRDFMLITLKDNFSYELPKKATVKELTAQQ